MKATENATSDLQVFSWNFQLESVRRAHFRGCWSRRSKTSTISYYLLQSTILLLQQTVCSTVFYSFWPALSKWHTACHTYKNPTISKKKFVSNFGSDVALKRKISKWPEDKRVAFLARLVIDFRYLLCFSVRLFLLASFERSMNSLHWTLFFE